MRMVLTRLKRWLYVRRMMHAIDVAREQGMYRNRMSRTCGLLVIKDFERVNGCAFNPGDSRHLDRVKGRANEAAFFRSINRVFRRHREQRGQHSCT